MYLSHILQADYLLPKDADRDITALTLDSRRDQQGGLFFAIKGVHLDGRQYIDQAISQGAVAVLIEADTPREALHWQGDVPLIPIDQLQQKMGVFAARFYNKPAQSLHMIGVTGTSGKTSCTQFIAQSLQVLKKPCGIIGTLGCGFYGSLKETGLTTPDAITLQSILRQFVEQAAVSVAMEVSSHSIDQGRINDIEFKLGVFTNLTQDHLDYHGDLATYAAVKRKFLASPATKQLIMNADDAHGCRWINELYTEKPIIAYGIGQSHSIPEQVPLIWADQVELTLDGIKAYIHSPWGDERLFLPLIGQFNLSNALAVLAVLCLSEVSFSEAIQQLSQLQAVPGRMQMLGGGVDKPLVVVDYAHKPDALEKVLQTLRLHTKGELWCVFGCGGERDRGKRPLMANIAEQLADHVIVTNDNPRHESPKDIVKDIMQGFVDPGRVTVEFDRSKAIQSSIQWSKAKDCILIAGKGAERYQQIGDEKTHFDDVETVSIYLSSSV